MMNAKEAPRYKGFFKIFFFFLLAMVGGFLGGELRALKADALTSSVPPPPLRRTRALDPCSGVPREQPASEAGHPVCA